MESTDPRQAIEAAKLETRYKTSANWFFWIAALSLVNSIVFLSGSQWHFLVGVGITQMIDAIGLGLAESLDPSVKIVAFVLDLLVVAVFVVFGLLARRGYVWAFVVGMVLYGIDALIFLAVADWLNVGFHVLVLFFICLGLLARRQREAMTPAPSPSPAAPPPGAPPAAG